MNSLSRTFLAYLARLIFVALAVVTVVFFLQRLLPGSPADAVLGPDAALVDKQRWLDAHGFDKTLLQQYQIYMRNLLQGDFGQRWLDGRPVAPLIVERFAVTVQLAISAMFVSVICAGFFGITGALKAGQRADKLIAFTTLLFVSAPTFVTGTAFLWIFSVWLDILPLTGDSGWKSFILPACSLGITLAVITGRTLRASLLEVLHEDYVRTARSKGVRPRQVFLRHALRNALLPTTTLLGLQMGSVLGGAIITEQVFTLRGLGSLLMEAVNQRDYNLLSSCVVVLSLVQVSAGAAVELIHRALDPRLGDF